jgi:hypothetical protein
MSEELTRAQLRHLRSSAIDRLSDGFANDLLDLDEFEDRIDRVHRASDRATIEELLGGLEPVDALAVRPESKAPTAAPSGSELALATQEPEAEKRAVAILGGVERKGAWRVPRKLRALAVLGGIELDLREAVFAPGVHEIKVNTLFGGVEIIVPPSVAVECEGSGILGGFESVNRSPIDPDPERPLVRIRGLAILGGVEVSTRLPGESERQARKRRKKELKAKRRKQLKG